MRRYIINKWDGPKPSPVLATNDFSIFKKKADELVEAGVIVHGRNRLLTYPDTMVLSFYMPNAYAYDGYHDCKVRGGDIWI